ncbi:hypothetical protein [Parablautia intestinalis]|uniref:hypothetical protein n=1 Tax=Parablautia intestinalis TaxID=2320100 RepID=UPI00256EE135|nr:hypothetical protein [Parablautia intestinalis]
MRYTVFSIGSWVICPVCKGMAIHDEETGIICSDCGTRFRVDGIGKNEREVVCCQMGGRNEKV